MSAILSKEDLAKQLAAATTKIDELRQQLKGTKAARDAWKLNSETHVSERNDALAALAVMTMERDEVQVLLSAETECCCLSQELQYKAEAELTAARAEVERLDRALVESSAKVAEHADANKRLTRERDAANSLLCGKMQAILESELSDSKLAECAQLMDERDAAVARAEKAEADLDRMTLHYAEVLHDARGKQGVAEADLAATQKNCERLASDRDDAIGKLADTMADSATLRAVLTECMAIYRHDERDDADKVEQMASIIEGALAASPCDAKAECEECKGLRDALARLQRTADHVAVCWTLEQDAITFKSAMDSFVHDLQVELGKVDTGETLYAALAPGGECEGCVFDGRCAELPAPGPCPARRPEKGGEGETHEERWARLGWPFSWCEQHRAYCRTGHLGIASPDERLPTVAAVDAWIAAQAAKGGGR